MNDRCVNDFCGYCSPEGEFAIDNCPFVTPYIEETWDWKKIDGKYQADKTTPKLIVHFDVRWCGAKPSDLIEMEDECWYCNGAPEYEDFEGEPLCLCPVDYPEECPYDSSKQTITEDKP